MIDLPWCPAVRRSSWCPPPPADTVLTPNSCSREPALKVLSTLRWSMPYQLGELPLSLSIDRRCSL